MKIPGWIWATVLPDLWKADQLPAGTLERIEAEIKGDKKRKVSVALKGHGE